MSYEFHDMGTAAVRLLESQNKMIYNGVNIDDELTDNNAVITTLNITGRGLANYSNNTVDAPGLDGALFESAYLEPRTLEVEIQITAINTESFRACFERLNKTLRTVAEVEIQFSDESDASYYGKYVSSDQPKEDSNEQVITLTLTCSNPFKEMAEQTIDYTNSEALTVDTDFPVKPYLEITFSDSTHEFKVHNTTQNLTIDYKRRDNFNTQVYHLMINENEVYRSTNQTEGYSGLVLSPGWEDFTIQTGDQIVIQPEPSIIKIHYKGVKL